MFTEKSEYTQEMNQVDMRKGFSSNYIIQIDYADVGLMQEIMKYYLCFDIGGNSMKSGLLSREWENH